MVEVVFRYDEETRKWQPRVTGCLTSVEARQAFTAVCYTVHEIEPRLQVSAIVYEVPEIDYTVVPAV